MNIRICWMWITPACASTIELATRFLWRKLDSGQTLPLGKLPLKVVYHTPCHMEKMGWSIMRLSCCG